MVHPELADAEIVVEAMLPRSLNASRCRRWRPDGFSFRLGRCPAARMHLVRLAQQTGARIIVPTGAFWASSRPRCREGLSKASRRDP